MHFIFLTFRVRLVRKSRYLKISPLEEKEGDRPLCCFACRREDRFFCASLGFPLPTFFDSGIFTVVLSSFPKKCKKNKKRPPHEKRAEERKSSKPKTISLCRIDRLNLSVPSPPCKQAQLVSQPNRRLVCLSLFYSLFPESEEKKKKEVSFLSGEKRKGGNNVEEKEEGEKKNSIPFGFLSFHGFVSQC